MPTGLVVNSSTVVLLAPTYEPTPPALVRTPLQIVGQSAPTPTLLHGRPAESDAAVVFRSMADEPWGSYRIVCGGRDVTYYDGMATKIGGYQLTEPYGYGDASFEFPQLTSLMVDQWGTGDLSWFDVGKPIELHQVDADLEFVRLIWKGFIVAPTPSLESTVVTCAGHGSGRLALRDRHPAVFTFFKDTGSWLYNAFRNVGLVLTPRGGPDTGITLDARGQSGTYLAFTDWLLSQWMEGDGDQGTVMPDATGSRYVAGLKDRTTKHYTVWNGVHGVDLDVTRDLSEEYTTIYGSGQSSNGQVWSNIKVPGLIQGTVPSFPGTLSLGDTGDDVFAYTSRLMGHGYLDREDRTNEFTQAVVDATERMQEDGGLAVTGIVNSATWTLAFSLVSTSPSLQGAYQAPLVQLSSRRKWNYTSSGAIAERNPNYNPALIEVDWTPDFGPGIRKSRARKWARRRLNRMQTGKNWAGTLTLTADVALGDADHGDTITPASRLDIDPGTNVQVHDFDGTTLFHVATVDVDSDQRVQLGIDTKARDALTLGQVLERNRASRQHPARQWLREHRGTDANRGQVHWSEFGGEIFTRVHCPSDSWTVFRVLAGQSGSIERIRVKTSDIETQFALIVTAKKIGPRYLNSRFGNPFDDIHNKFKSDAVQRAVDRERAVLFFAGTPEEPLGYDPGRHVDPLTGENTTDPVTGLFLEDGGWDYHTFDQPVLYVGIYVEDECYLEPQRILWPVMEAGNN